MTAVNNYLTIHPFIPFPELNMSEAAITSTSTAPSALNRRDVTRDIFSASIGSVACCYTGQPFDTVKVRMQTNPSAFPSVAFTTRSILANEGASALWKGAVPTAMGMVAENAMAFGVNEALKRTFPDEAKKDPTLRPDLVKPFLMGAITGCCSATVLIPSEIVKAKTQVIVGNVEASSTEVYKKMIRQHGLRSLFVGFDAQIMRDAPFYAFFFGTYELNCYLFRTYVPSMPEELNYFLSGGFAGMLGWTAAMPFDVPKTNVQASWESRVVGSYFPELFRIVKERGPLALYTGLVPTLARAFPANAALFLGVEMGKKFFDRFVWP
ncbi:hypothetical protein HJC23_003876 [Cyclotella cryptica]|uniref:Mitochondrial carrier protein n=1 Tax=Cyclotella cryptica TaxID=29204 RepID=A0ABD3PU21_9STRA